MLLENLRESHPPAGFFTHAASVNSTCDLRQVPLIKSKSMRRPIGPTRVKTLCGEGAFAEALENDSDAGGRQAKLAKIPFVLQTAEVTGRSCIHMERADIATESSNSSPAWHALYTRHQHEKTAARLLTGKGFEAFLPLYDAIHCWKNGAKQLSLPLFPCYVFVYGAINRWLSILSTPGIHSVVGFGGKPAIIPHCEIEAVRRAVDSAARVEPHPFMRCGDRVRIKDGALRGLEGILLRKKGLWQLLLSVEMLERSVAVEIEVSMVERIYASKPRLARTSQTSVPFIVQA
jgi:transcription antitermination factor NusG